MDERTTLKTMTTTVPSISQEYFIKSLRSLLKKPARTRNPVEFETRKKKELQLSVREIERKILLIARETPGYLTPALTHALLRAHSKTGDIERAERVYETHLGLLRSRQGGEGYSDFYKSGKTLKHNLPHNLLFKAYAQAHATSPLAWRMLTKGHESHCRKIIARDLAPLSECTREGSSGESSATFDTFTLNLIIDGFARSASAPALHNLKNTESAIGNEEMGQALMERRRQGHFHTTVSFLREFTAKNSKFEVPIDTTTINTLVKVACRAHCVDKAFHLVENSEAEWGVGVDRVGYNTLIDFIGSLQDGNGMDSFSFDQIEGLIGAMMAKEIGVDEFTVNAAISGHAFSSSSRAVSRSIDTVESFWNQHKVLPKKEIFVGLFRKLRKEGDSHEAKRLSFLLEQIREFDKKNDHHGNAEGSFRLSRDTKRCLSAMKGNSILSATSVENLIRSIS